MVMKLKQISSSHLPSDKVIEMPLANTKGCVRRYMEGKGVNEALEQLDGKLMCEGASSEEYNAAILQASILITHHVL